MRCHFKANHLVMSGIPPEVNFLPNSIPVHQASLLQLRGSFDFSESGRSPGKPGSCIRFLMKPHKTNSKKSNVVSEATINLSTRESPIKEFPDSVQK